MWNRIRRLPSPAMAVAFVALLAAIGGTAVALPGKNSVKKDDIAKNAVNTADIKNGTVKLVDISKATAAALKGQQGAAGPAGPAGPSGPAGETGARGPSDGFASFKDGPVALPFSSTAFTTIASLGLPAGSYLVYAKATITNNAGAGDTAARCRLSSAGQFDEALAGLEDVNVSGSADAGVISLNVAATLGADGTATLACRNEGGGSTNARFIKLSAIRVATLSNVPSP